jgi:hypothetical protein
MKRLPPAKRNQLIVVILATVGLICLVYFLLISPQADKNRKLGADISKESLRLQQYKTAIAQIAATTTNLAALNQRLNLAEQDVASGDVYEWTYDTLRRFKGNYRVEIPTVSQPSQSECDLISNFPYKQIRFALNGTAYFHDLGKFISDFENKFPHCRVLNVTLDPANTGVGGGEKLAFRIEIVALVKPNI